MLKATKLSRKTVLDQPQTVIHQPEVNLLENIELDFPEGQIEKDIETYSPYQGTLLNKNIIPQQKKKTL